MNDPGWDTVRNLKDDHERRQFAIASFGNIEPADPTKNMSYHGYLRQKLRIQQVGYFLKGHSKTTLSKWSQWMSGNWNDKEV